jgi:PAS domain S-box-containing protein
VSRREDDERAAAELLGFDAATAEAFATLERLAQALFPAGDADRAHLTWPDRREGGALLDETARAAARLRAAEARFRTLVEQIPAVTFMAVLGEGENEIYISPHIESILGYTQHEWLADPFLWYWRLHPDDRQLWNAEFARGVQTGGPFKAECRFLAKDGHVVWVHGEARLVRDEHGRPQFLQGVAFDITESKRAQEVLLNEAVRTAKIEEEIAIARRVQTSLLPRDLEMPGVELAATMIPASEVGGDYYDVLPLSDGGWIAIGDVSGHGLSAGLVMLMVQSAMAAATHSRDAATPRQVLRVVNDVLVDNIRRRMRHGDYVTLSLLRYFSDGRLLFAGAHQDLLYYSRRTGRVECIESPGTWLGADREIAHVTVDTELRVEEGDLIVLYTDGVTEAMNHAGEQLGIERLRAAVEEVAAEPVERVRDHVLACVRGWMATQEDDITVLALRFSRADRRDT